jgi:hypothetical protein
MYRVGLDLCQIRDSVRPLKFSLRPIQSLLPGLKLMTQSAHDT